MDPNGSSPYKIDDMHPISAQRYIWSQESVEIDHWKVSRASSIGHSNISERYISDLLFKIPLKRVKFDRWHDAEIKQAKRSRRCDTSCRVDTAQKRNTTEGRARQTVPSRRFPVVDRRTTSSRKDKVSFLFAAIASDVSRAVQFCYIMHAVSPQVRSSAYPSSFLSLLFSRGSSFSTNHPVQYSDGGCIDVKPRQRGRTRFLDRELYFAGRLSLFRCNNAGSYAYTRMY